MYYIELYKNYRVINYRTFFLFKKKKKFIEIHLIN